MDFSFALMAFPKVMSDCKSPPRLPSHSAGCPGSAQSFEASKNHYGVAVTALGFRSAMSGEGTPPPRCCRPLSPAEGEASALEARRLLARRRREVELYYA